MLELPTAEFSKFQMKLENGQIYRVLEGEKKNRMLTGLYDRRIEYGML
jgi:hypothetical protein